MKILLCSLFLIPLLISPTRVQSADFKLQSLQALITPSSREYRMEVTNTDSLPMLLVTKVSDNKGNIPYATHILVYPPVTRIEPGSTQFIRLRLKQDAPPLKQDTQLRLSLNGVGQSAQGAASAGLTQIIPFVVRYADRQQGANFWDDLRWQQRDKQLVISNPGARLVRLKTEITLFPSKHKLSLAKSYISPGETLTLPMTDSRVEKVEITPFNADGAPQEPVTLGQAVR